MCAPDDARDACTKASLADGASCRENTGRCYDGACIPIACGDGLVDPGEGVAIASEMCDDGNTVSGDGCSADCRSNELCGNGVVDPTNELCDDGNPFSSDGCDVRCLSEQPVWTPVVLALPPPFADPAMAFDPIRGETILVSDFSSQNRTYKLNRAWSVAPTTLQPQGRSGASMIYDVANRGIVLYGGDDNGALSSFSDTWVWNGSEWRLASPMGAAGRARAGIAYDARRKRVVLFGGASKRQLPTPLIRDDTWEWDGTEWIEIETPVTPSPRADAAMAYDPVRGVTVLFGGVASNTRNDETWEYDGTTWTRITTPVSPPALDGAAMVAYHGKILLFGGSTAALGSDQQDTWLYDGTTWEKVLNAERDITPRRGLGMVYDSARDRVIAFGGSSTLSDNTVDSKTFVFEGTAWRELDFVDVLPAGVPQGTNDPTHGRAILITGLDTAELVDDAWRNMKTEAPGTVDTYALTYDIARDHALLVGGPTNDLVDTWRMADERWTKITPRPSPSPPGRMNGSISFDRARGVAVFYGGTSSPTGTDDDTWTWDGTAWHLAASSSLMGTRDRAAMVYDPIRQQTILFGGTPFDDHTYAWDGATWTDVTGSAVATDRPLARKGASMAWNPNRQRIAMFGGLNPFVGGGRLDDLWEWDGTRWTPVPIAIRPTPRDGAAFVPDSNGVGMWLFGGNQSGGSPDLWHLSWEGATLRDRCLDRRDTDEDLLLGCDDPDCWSVCHPLCEPGMDCTGVATCGDGVAAPTETCRICPEDTGGVCEICGDAYCAPSETTSCTADCQ